MPPFEPPVVQPQRGRLMDVATYVALAVMGVLGAQLLATPVARTAAAALCLTFGLLHALAFPRIATTRAAIAYFAAQTAVVTALLLISPDPNEFFSFLFYLLTILAATLLPVAAAGGWIALFLAITLLTNSDLFGTPRWVLIAFTASVLLVCGFLGHSLRASELARRHNQALLDELARAQRRLQELTLAEERNRLAREIHDGLGHYLTATTMQIQGARAVLETAGVAGQAPAALAALGKAETLLHEALADVRRSVAALRGAATDRPLAARIGELVESGRTPAGPETHFVLLGSPRPLPPQAEQTLYRAVQEGLTNAAKHAQAHRVDVTLAYTTADVRLTITDDGRTDDGRGGDATAGGGYGLLGLQERVQLLGGALHVERPAGQGFQLRVELPV
jgi:signal transduction histidine kinase